MFGCGRRASNGANGGGQGWRVKEGTSRRRDCTAGTKIFCHTVDHPGDVTSAWKRAKSYAGTCGRSEWAQGLCGMAVCAGWGLWAEWGHRGQTTQTVSEDMAV